MKTRVSRRREEKGRLRRDARAGLSRGNRRDPAIPLLFFLHRDDVGGIAPSRREGALTPRCPCGGIAPSRREGALTPRCPCGGIAPSRREGALTPRCPCGVSRRREKKGRLRRDARVGVSRRREKKGRLRRDARVLCVLCALCANLVLSRQAEWKSAPLKEGALTSR